MSYSSHTIINIGVVLCWALTPLITAYAGPQSPPPIVIASHCSDHCGDVSIPYPFGIEEGCYFKQHNNSAFQIQCNDSTSPPTPIFGRNLEVLNISVTDAELRCNVPSSFDCYNQTGYRVYWSWENLNLVSFTLSSAKNILVAIGCDTYSWFRGFRHDNNNKEYQTGCMTKCVEPEDVIDGECSGIGCCQASIPTKVKYVTVEVDSFSNHTLVYNFNPCSAAFPIAKDAFRFNPKILSLELSDFQRSHGKLFPGKKVPAVFNWAIGTENCSAAKAVNNCLCKQNAECYDPEHEVGYRCQCKHGFTGNPYLPHGCTDIDECKEGKNDCEKQEYCINTVGGYYCNCPKGQHGHGTVNDRCISNRNLIPVLAGVSVTLGSIISFLVGWWLYLMSKRHQIIKQRAKCFERNGGLLLQQEVSSNEVEVRIKVYTIDELEKATDYFNEGRILGQGGQGTVYKGMLGEGRIVAIKKSKMLKEKNQVAEFINEVVILSRINHRNIVKLFGCCFETEVPLLVYEFIPNGTLSDHIHACSEDRFPITWKMRLQIASDSAVALAYLHSSTSTLIFHRDIKSSNILLDDKYRAKLSDFGTSRSVPTDQTRVLTHVVGTIGYLDPEYFQSHQFTEKSDVYSFGVVLVELLSGQKAIRASCEQERSLISWFLSHMENSSVHDIVDSEVLQEGLKEEFLTIANLAKRCLNLDGKNRPTMKEVLLEIEAVLSLHLPQTCHPNDRKSEQMVAATSSSAHSSTFSLESRTLDSAEISLLYNPR